LYICDSDSVGSSTTNETEQCGPAVWSLGETSIFWCFFFSITTRRSGCQFQWDWTVFQAREAIATRYHTIPSYVSLLFCARNLKDDALFKKSHHAVHPINIYIRRPDASLLESFGYSLWRGATTWKRHGARSSDMRSVFDFVWL
jgi:hypothetical protein